MGEALAKYEQSKRKSDRPQEDDLSSDDRAALRTIQREARKHRAILTSGGKGGLPPGLVLGVFRRDRWRCKIHGDRGQGDRGGLGVHHKGGLENPTSKWLKKKGHDNDPNNLVTLCKKAHDEIHNRDRALGEGDGDKKD